MVGLIYAIYLIFILYAFLQFYWAVHFLLLKINKPNNSEFQKWSILIPFRNEALNLSSTLDSILNQSYPNKYFEIILINDHSSDQSTAVIETLIQSAAECQIHLIHNKGFGKKAAIDTGINFCQNELIITTDADTTRTIDWLKSINQYFSDKNLQILSGPVLQIPKTDNAFHFFQALDYIGLCGISLVAGNRGIFYNASGANLAFRKNFYSNTLEQRKDAAIASGDDIFLVQQVKNKQDIYFAKDQNLVVYTGTESTWLQFIAQRLRWGSKSFNYSSLKIPALWSLPVLVSYLLIILFIFALIKGRQIWFGLFLFGFTIKFVADFALLKVTNDYFKKPRFKYFLIAEFIHIYYLIELSIRIIFFRRYKWKGRLIQK